RRCPYTLPTLCSFFSFFFYCPLPPRFLHSFPTRRSSDLFSRSVRGPFACPNFCSRHRDHAANTERRTCRRCRNPEAGGPSSACRDRKSTRLNSSHVSISYAVFCLKKKKKKKKKSNKKIHKKKKKYKKKEKHKEKDNIQ